MSRLTDAYVAGLIDGEGCVSVQKATNGWSHSPRVDVGMTVVAIDLLNALKAEYGGAVRRTRPATDKWAEAWAWCASGPAAVTVLARCLPHLVLKEEQARLALKVDEIKLSLPETSAGRRRWDEDAGARCAAIKDRIQELNRKGPEPKTEPGWFAQLVAGQFLTNQADLLSDLGWSRFSSTLPRSGSMRNGRLYERPTLVQRTAANDSSSSPLLGTPTAHERTHSPRAVDHGIQLANQVADLGSRMLPTATVSDVYTGNLASSQQKPGSMHSVTLPQAVERLLKTPTSNLGSNGGSQHPDKRKAGGHGPSLQDEVEHLLPTPRSTDGPKGGPGQVNGRGVPDSLPAIGKLLPTPITSGSNTAALGRERSQLREAVHLIGETSPPPSDGGSEPSDGLLPLPLWTDD